MKTAIEKRNEVTDNVAKFSVGFLLICAFFISGALAQSESGSASLEGTVRDQNGAVIQGATVTVKNTGTNLTRTVTSDSNGSFSVSVLPVGSYDVTTQSTGFLEMPVKIILRVGETTPVDVVLAPQGTSVLVNVSGDAETIDAETQSTGSIISQRLVEDLPVRGRNFTEFVSLTPAVVQEIPTWRLTARISTTRCKEISAAATNRSFSFRKPPSANFKSCVRARTPKSAERTPVSSTSLPNRERTIFAAKRFISTATAA